MKHWIRRGLACAAALLVLAVADTTARAGLISGASGNTRPFLGSNSTQGIVNFATFDKTGGVAGDSYGTGIANFDSIILLKFGANALTGAYLYLYQTVNTASVTPPLSQNSVGVVSASVIARGILNGYVFRDNAGLASPTNPFGNTAATAQQNSPASTGVTLAGSAIASSTTDIVPVSLNLGAGSIQAVYNAPNYLPVGRVSSLFGYTSNLGPGTLSTGIIDGGASANGTIYGGVTVTVIPEPSTIAMLGIAGVCGALGFARKKLRHRAQST